MARKKRKKSIASTIRRAVRKAVKPRKRTSRRTSGYGVGTLEREYRAAAREYHLAGEALRSHREAVGGSRKRRRRKARR